MHRPRKCCLQKLYICAGPVMSVVVNLSTDWASIHERERGGRRKSREGQREVRVRKIHNNKESVRRKDTARGGDRWRARKIEGSRDTDRRGRGHRQKCQEREKEGEGDRDMGVEVQELRNRTMQGTTGGVPRGRQLTSRREEGMCSQRCGTQRA